MIIVVSLILLHFSARVHWDKSRTAIRWYPVNSASIIRSTCKIQYWECIKFYADPEKFLSQHSTAAYVCDFLEGPLFFYYTGRKERKRGGKSDEDE